MCFKGVRAGHRECVAQGVGGRQRKDNSTCISGKEYDKKRIISLLIFLTFSFLNLHKIKSTPCVVKFYGFQQMHRVLYPLPESWHRTVLSP